MATLQVKGMDDALYQALAARAAQDNRSISQEVVTVIQDYLARPRSSVREANEAFLELCGAWADDRSAREIVADIRKHRRDSRRFRDSNRVLD